MNSGTVVMNHPDVLRDVLEGEYTSDDDILSRINSPDNTAFTGAMIMRESLAHTGGGVRPDTTAAPVVDSLISPPTNQVLPRIFSGRWLFEDKTILYRRNNIRTGICGVVLVRFVY